MLRDVYVRGKYQDIILPMVVIRRLDAVLEQTKQEVLAMRERLDSAGVIDQDAALRQASGQAFYNISLFTLRDLKSRARAQRLRADFEAYLDGFSPNVREILEKFKFRNQIPSLVEADALGYLIEKFLDGRVNLSPTPALNADGSVRVPALDNHGMGTIFEELIRHFNKENNEEAGEHFTPRDVVGLMADLILLSIAERIQSGTYRLYDGACGTGGMLTVAEKRLKELAEEHGKEVSIHLFGQEVNPETYAITKADLLIKGEGADAENFRLGSTLSADGFPAREFDFMLSNPPYGKSWKTDLERMGGKGGILDPRFVTEHAGDPDFNLTTRSSDGQLMFLVNKLAKMKHDTSHRRGELSGRGAKDDRHPALRRGGGDRAGPYQRHRAHAPARAGPPERHPQRLQRPVRQHRVEGRRQDLESHNRGDPRHGLQRRGLPERHAELR